MFIRFPAPPGGLARSLTVSESTQDGEVVISPRPPTPPPQATSDAAAKPAADSTPSLLKNPNLPQAVVKATRP